MLAEVGEGGFGAQDFELTQQLGALSWVSSCASCASHGPPCEDTDIETCALLLSSILSWHRPRQVMHAA